MKIFDILLEKLIKEKRDRCYKFKDDDIFKTLKIAIPAQGASSSTYVVSALGQAQLNINGISFCKEFDLETKIFDNEIMLNTTIFARKNKSFFFKIKSPSVAFLVYEYFGNFLSNNNNENFMMFNYPKNLPLSIFFKIAHLKSKYTGKSIFAECKNLNSALFSMNIQLINDLSL